MESKPTYKELEQKVKELEDEAFERKRAEEALRESEEKFKLISEQSLMAIVIVQDDRIKYANQAYSVMTGYTWEEIRNWTVGDTAELIYPGDRHFVMEQGRKKAAGIRDGVVTHYSYRGVTKSGEVRWIDQYSKTITYRGKPADLMTFIDIHDQKLTQENLKKSEEKLRTIIEHSNELFYIHDTEHTLTYASQTSKDLLGYTPEEMMIKWPELATDNPVNQKGLEVTEKGIATGEKQAPYLLELAKKDGTNVWLEIDESPVKDATGKVVAISGAARDVTEQKRTEQRLLKSEKGFRDLFDSITDLIYTQDLDGCFTSINHAMCKVFGYERDELIGRPASDFMKPEMRPFFESGYLEQIKTKGSLEGITSYFAKNGDKIYIDYRSSLVEPDHGAPYISGTGRDVTEQVLSRREIKRLQNQVHQSQKMEAIGTLAGGVAHDLNNILGGLVSYPELLLLQLPEDSPLRKSILTIQKSGEKAAAVVQDLLTLARRGVVVTEVVNLNDVVAEYLKSPEHENLQSYHPGVLIETHLEKESLNILGSSTHLSKTVMNLVANAAEAMSEGGALTVSTENRYIDRPVRGYDDIKEGDYVVLTVSDTGTGIASDDMEKIFEPFYTKKKMGRSGTGLGMAVVWGTVKDHKGYIDVQSTEGEGTTFTLYFPVTRKLVEKKSEISLKDCMGKGEEILVVDDVEEQRKIASGMLKELGYSVVSVPSGEEAVEYLTTNKVELLVLDMIMEPGMDGLDTYKKIIERHPGQKAIIASGFSETDRAKELQHLGGGAYIKKPFLLEKIGIAVKEELKK